ncbi:heavy metal translocating P-type ATPase [Eisenbergiella tayi]|uniref:heavy metal translocating P-type ATPase n=1 Tax=Eisenbergiella tayi TaxID=1432052 RepID=UPI000AC8AFFE|nr:heavy metal translocating P-type ATPase [Eisenbergiella tayi]
MTRKIKKRMQRILIGAACFAAAVLLENLAPGLPWYVLLAAFLVSYVIIGGDVVKRAVSNIGKGQVFDENFLMTIATVGAFFVGDYPEAVAVMLFYQVGELFQTYAVNRSRKNITELMDIRPDFANVRRNGVEKEVDPDEVAVGELIVVKPGERIPLDGVIVKGNSSLDTMALTGESVPREVLCGEEVISGCINLTGVLEVEVSKPFGESTVSKILDLVENASSKKAEAENFITKFARYYTPIVVICAAALAIIPPLFLGGWSDWIYRGLTFLVVSCPCAVVISVPLSFFGGLGGASKAGVLIKGSNYLEALAETEIVVMDKTGTLTKGTFKVKEVQPALEGAREVISKEELLEITAYAESYSNHPISLSIQKEYGKELDKGRLESTQELAGHGVHAVIDGADIYAGNEKLMQQQKISFTHAAQIGTIVHVARDNQYLGYILIADEVKDDAAACISGLKAEGVKRIVMLTGDRRETAEYVASQIGLTEVHSGLLPGDKVDEVEKLIQSKSPKGKLIFVGDGINDAPVLARADIGIAMGGLGSDAAIEAADVVIMTDEPSRIATAMKISRKTLGIVKQNIVFALGVKILVLILAAIGMANMWLAVFADVGVAVLAILNAMRALQGIPCKQGKGID